jgi:glycosyltransferase involved in cell wall biosynthesis
MNIALIEPFFGGSHKKWCEGLQAHSQHHVVIFSLSAHHWKWRMHAAAITLAEQLFSHELSFDLVVASDFLDVALFKSLLGNKGDIPIALYFHENQISYPWSPTDPDVSLNRNNTYGFINYTSCLVADQVYFNSNYHLQSFIGALPKFLKQFPDHQNLDTIDLIKNKSEVLPLGMDYSAFDKTKPASQDKNILPLILWNHRWEYDKNPEGFFHALYELKNSGIKFNLVVLGQQLKKSPPIFSEARELLHNEILHWGFCGHEDDYARWLWKADILPVTSNQDFFGISVIEALYCNTLALLPKRLAYAEHFNFLDQSYCYDNHDELVEKLTWCCQQLTIIRNQEPSANLNDYGWVTMGPVYDSRMAELKAVHRSY